MRSSAVEVEEGKLRHTPEVFNGKIKHSPKAEGGRMSHTPIQTLGSVFSSCCLLAGDSFRVLVEEEGCSGLARMVWPAGCAWGHSSVGSTILIFRIPPSIVSHVEGKGRGGTKLLCSPCPHPKADLDSREVPLVSVINETPFQVMSSVLQQEEVACILLCGNGKALKAVKITRPRGREDCVNYFQRDLLSSLKPGIHVPAGL